MMRWHKRGLKSVRLVKKQNTIKHTNDPYDNIQNVYHLTQKSSFGFGYWGPSTKGGKLGTGLGKSIYREKDEEKANKSAKDDSQMQYNELKLRHMNTAFVPHDRTRWKISRKNDINRKSKRDKRCLIQSLPLNIITW